MPPEIPDEIRIKAGEALEEIEARFPDWSASAKADAVLRVVWPLINDEEARNG